MGLSRTLSTPVPTTQTLLTKLHPLAMNETIHASQQQKRLKLIVTTYNPLQQPKKQKIVKEQAYLNKRILCVGLRHGIEDHECGFVCARC